MDTKREDREKLEETPAPNVFGEAGSPLLDKKPDVPAPDKAENSGNSSGNLTKNQVIAIIAAAIVVVLAAIVICGVAFGGWLKASGEQANQSSQNAASSSSTSVNTGISSGPNNAQNVSGNTASTNANNASSNEGTAVVDAAGNTNAVSGSANTDASTSSAADNAASASSSGNSPSSSLPDSGSGHAYSGQSGSGTSADDFSGGPSATLSVTVIIDSSRAHAYNSAWPESMGVFELELEEGSTVYDALCATNAIISGNSTYVRSINGLAEFACGQKSGWIYQVDGETPNKSCGAYVLTGDETITWIYTCDYQADGF